MVQLEPSGSTVTQPKPKYGHLSIMDPEFAPLKEETDKMFTALWSLPLDDFKNAWLTAPVALPEDVPLPGKDYEVADQQIPTRDGTMIGLRVYRPVKHAEKATLVLKAHGGGWVVGSHEVEEVENRMLAAHSGAVVASVDYRMAPEYKFPYAVNDCFDALKWCKSNTSALGINPESIILAGGSAGGNIAAVLSLMARNEQESGVIGQILNIPVTCHPAVFPRDKYEYGSYEQNKDASIIDAPRMNWFWAQYMPSIEPEVYAHPLLAESHANLPPALIQVAGLDPLRDEGFSIRRGAQDSGSASNFKGVPRFATWLLPFPALKQSREYWQSAVDFVKSFSLSGKL